MGRSRGVFEEIAVERPVRMVGNAPADPLVAFVGVAGRNRRIRKNTFMRGSSLMFSVAVWGNECSAITASPSSMRTGVSSGQGQSADSNLVAGYDATMAGGMMPA